MSAGIPEGDLILASLMVVFCAALTHPAPSLSGCLLLSTRTVRVPCPSLCLLGHPPYPLSPSSVPAGTNQLLITTSTACQLLPAAVCGAAPSPTPTAAVS